MKRTKAKISSRQRAVVEAALTPQRTCVLEAVRNTDAHPTANEVYLQAQQRLPGISFATVYNSLRYLTAAGLVSELTFGNGASRFDRRIERHDHAWCTQCGLLADLALDETAELMRMAARRSRFKAESVHLTLYGLCPN
ncbi:MAG: transcriptional repressor [Acidobacteria bacterium]|nr:transcriptional repressor [Acidobacteriota bacterium]MBI3428317.1 transcriptional repressor [Acidobacteriota bacterium]